MSLAQATRAFFQKDSPTGAIAFCITDYALGNLLWLKNPAKAPELPRRRLIADAYAAMRPPATLWKVYLAEIAHLEETGKVSSDEYYMLRYSLAARAALMDLTHGNLEAFSEGTVAEVLEVAKLHVRADLEASLTSERIKRTAVENQVAQLKSAEAMRVERLHVFSERLARWSGRLIFTTGLILLGIACLSTFPWKLPTLKRNWAQYGLTFIQAGLLVFLIFSMAKGTTVREIVRNLERRLTQSIENRLRRWLAISE